MNKKNESYLKLLKVTEELIVEKGCKKTTMQEIINQSGISKGGIYHYVSSKDELFLEILKNRLRQMSEHFYEVVQTQQNDLEAATQSIVESNAKLSDPKEPSNIIFMYLLGNLEDEKTKERFNEFLNASVRYSQEWIELGQKKGAINNAIDAKKIGELFTVISYGIRVRNSVKPEQHHFTMGDYYDLIISLLKK